MPEADERKTIKVYGDKYAKARNAIPAYERVLRTRKVTFTCLHCGNSVTELVNDLKWGLPHIW